MKNILETPSRPRRDEFLAAVARSRKLHHPWVTPPGTPEAFDRYLKRYDGSAHIAFWIRVEEGELAGAIHINEIVRGIFQSGYLGYFAFVPQHEHGYMTEGLRAAVSHAFRKLKLHRLEANIQPANEAS